MNRIVLYVYYGDTRRFRRGASHFVLTLTYVGVVRPLRVDDVTGRDKKAAVLLGIEPRRRFVDVYVENRLNDFLLSLVGSTRRPTLPFLT